PVAFCNCQLGNVLLIYNIIHKKTCLSRVIRMYPSDHGDLRYYYLLVKMKVVGGGIGNSESHDHELHRKNKHPMPEVCGRGHEHRRLAWQQEYIKRVASNGVLFG
ncbi:hypothetical protein ACJX0J_005339, partial [Zea mays]